MVQNFFGYIGYDGKIENLPFFIKQISIDDTREVINNTNLPVLIVGYDAAKDIYGDDFNILNRKINVTRFWTFKKFEKRILYEKDLPHFYNTVLKMVNETVKYYYINPFKVNTSFLRKFILIKNSTEQKILYSTDKMIYLSYKKYVMGFSYEALEYIGISKDKIDKHIGNFKNTIKVNNSKKISFSLKKIIGQEYLIPYFYHE